MGEEGKHLKDDPVKLLAKTLEIVNLQYFKISIPPIMIKRKIPPSLKNRNKEFCHYFT